MLRVAIIFERLGPYHVARLRAAAEILDLVAIEVRHTDDVYDWDVIDETPFERVTLATMDNSSSYSQSALMSQALQDVHADVVAVNGWSEPIAIAAFDWCLRHGTPTIVMSESTRWDHQRRRYYEWVKYRIVRNFSAGFVGGTPHRDYITDLGLPPERCFLGYDAVDNHHYYDDAMSSARPSVPDKFFLASARFVEKKNLSGLISAYSLYLKNTPIPWSLVLLGDGELRPKLEHQISELGLEDWVLLPGFKQYDELPAYYHEASAFVHASTTEQWGLVINEAMAAGLPVLVSRRCGCAQDLVEDGVNGWIFDPRDEHQLANLMTSITAASWEKRNAMGVASRHRIGEWGPDRFADGLLRAAKSALATGAKRASWLDKKLIESRF